MPRRRTDPNRCANGHDLSSDRNRYRLPSGKVECRQCHRERMARLRNRTRQDEHPSPQDRVVEREMTPAEVERFLARSREEEDLPAYLKPRRMWPDDPPGRAR